MNWDTALTLAMAVAKALLIYALPWGFAFEISNLLVHGQGALEAGFPGENFLEHVRDILLYGLSLIAGGIFWAFSYILVVAALHQGMLAWLSWQLSWNKKTRLAAHLALGVLTGLALLFFLRQPGSLYWFGFNYYTPPLAVSGFVSCVVASACAGLYSSWAVTDLL